MVCPGPVFSRILENLFTETTDRTLNLESEESKHRHRMKTVRCAKLMATSMANRLDEVWICRQPLLSLFYMNQYAPTLMRKVVCRLATDEKLSKIRDGIE